MSAAKHTPGPWRIEPNHLDFRILAGAHVVVARVAGDARTDTEERRAMVADAALIAAAPDLLEAAERALNYIANTEGELGITLDSGDALRAALKKARPE